VTEAALPATNRAVDNAEDVADTDVDNALEACKTDVDNALDAAAVDIEDTSSPVDVVALNIAVEAEAEAVERAKD
jgi:hypothetical protein